MWFGGTLQSLATQHMDSLCRTAADVDIDKFGMRGLVLLYALILVVTVV